MHCVMSTKVNKSTVQQSNRLRSKEELGPKATIKPNGSKNRLLFRAIIASGEHLRVPISCVLEKNKRQTYTTKN